MHRGNTVEQYNQSLLGYSQKVYSCFQGKRTVTWPQRAAIDKVKSYFNELNPVGNLRNFDCLINVSTCCWFYSNSSSLLLMLSQLESSSMWSADYILMFSVLQNICVTPQFKDVLTNNCWLKCNQCSQVPWMWTQSSTRPQKHLTRVMCVHARCRWGANKEKRCCPELKLNDSISVFFLAGQQSSRAAHDLPLTSDSCWATGGELTGESGENTEWHAPKCAFIRP